MDTIIIFCAKYLFLAVILILAYVWLKLKSSRKWEMAAVVVLAGILAVVASRIAGKLYFDPRPFVTHNVKPLVSHGGDNGFPSDHSLLSMSLAAATYLYSRKLAAAALVITVIVGIARVMAHVHSPIDIIGAWAISIAAVTAAYYLIKLTPWFKPVSGKTVKSSSS